MNDQSQDFEQLRRLLALKRHENPPPGYFRDFSNRVIAQIEQEDTVTSQGWISKLVELFRLRPAISASFSLATVLVLLAGTTLFESGPTGTATKLPVIEPKFAVTPEPVLPANTLATVFVTNLEPSRFALDMAPPVAQKQPTNNSLFSSPFYLRVEPVTFNR